MCTVKNFTYAPSVNMHKKYYSQKHYFVHQKLSAQNSVLIPRITSVNPVYGFWSNVYV